jgi:hypothetical protein
MARKRPLPPLTDPAHVADAFATGFEVQDHWEEWLRLTGWAECVDAGETVRRKSVSVVVPRSSVAALMRELRLTVAHQREARH